MGKRKVCLGRFLLLCAVVLLPQLAAAAQFNVENPAPNSTQSGISAISGWKCAAGTITVHFDGGPGVAVAYGTSRADTVKDCGDENNGFGLLWNWNLLKNGKHTVEFRDNGVVFSSVEITVTTFDAEFLTGQTGTLTGTFAGHDVALEWSQSLQNFVVRRAEPSSSLPFADQPAFTFDIDATRGWQATSLLVHKGQTLSFSASGFWTVDYRYFSYVGPDGYPPEEDSTIFQGCKLAPSEPYGLLLVRIGDNPDFELLGRSGELIASYDGPVSFRINDDCLLDNAGTVRVTVTGPELAGPTAPPFFSCITGPGEGGGCADGYKNPVPSPPDEVTKTIQLINSPAVAPCVLSVLGGLAQAAEKAGAGQVPALQRGIAVLRIAALLANIPGFFDNYFKLIIKLEQSGNTPEDLAYWIDWTRGVVDILVGAGIDKATFKSCQTLWTNPPPVQ